MHPLRKQRLMVFAGVVIASAAAVSLVLFALGENINHFYAPAQVTAGQAPINQTVRVGGLVKEGSVSRADGSLAVYFTLTDGAGEFVVVYEGILPDLFREGQGIVATGKLHSNGQFEADEVLAKHDENYMPPEVADALRKAGQLKSETVR